MKTTIWIFISDNGDGSASAHFFNSEKEAEDYAEKQEQIEGDYGRRFCDDIIQYDLEFDENGELLNPDTINWK